MCRYITFPQSASQPAPFYDSLRAGLRPVARLHGACGRSTQGGPVERWKIGTCYDTERVWAGAKSTAPCTNCLSVHTDKKCSPGWESIFVCFWELGLAGAA